MKQFLKTLGKWLWFGIKHLLLFVIGIAAVIIMLPIALIRRICRFGKWLFGSSKNKDTYKAKTKKRK